MPNLTIQTSKLMYNNCNMIIHILANIPKAKTRKDSNSSKRNTGVVNERVSRCIRFLSSKHKSVPFRQIAIYTRQEEDILNKRRACQLRNVSDYRCIEDPILHGSNDDILRQDRDELVVENIIIGGIPNRTTNNTNSKRERRNRSNEIIRTNDSGDNGSWDDDASDTKTGDDEDSIDGVKVVEAGGSEGSAASSHHARRDDHEGSVIASEDREKPEDDAGTGEDGETDGHAAEAHPDWVVAVDVEGLGRPEEKDGEEVCARDEGDD